MYKVLNGMAINASIHADYRFYCYLVANTILVLASVELYGKFYILPKEATEPWRVASGILAFSVSIFGAWLGWTFWRFLKRTKLYERHYIAWAAKMEIDKQYCPKPYLWTGLIRELAEDINNLDNLDILPKCTRQQKTQKTLGLLKRDEFKGSWVRGQRILPSEIEMERLGALKPKDAPLDDDIGKYGRPKVALGSAYSIYKWVPIGFMVIFLAIAALPIISIILWAI